MNQFEMMALFIQVAELGSFAAAATQKGIARSVVTRQIAALEAHLGVQLIARSTRRQALTSAGKVYLERCKAIIDLVQQSEAELIEEQLTPKGNLRVSLPLSFGLRHLSDVLMQFAQRYPDIHLELDYSDRMVDVAAEGFDVAIRIASELALSDIVRKIGQCELYFVAAPSYLALHGTPQSPEDLLQHQCLQYSHHSRWMFTESGKEVSFSTKGRIKANNGDALAKAAAAGMGVSLMPDFIARDYLADGRLTRILSDATQAPIGIYAVLPSNSYIPERVKLVVDFLAENVPISLQEQKGA
ncbi:LysR family transcriptional regulator [uncultured Paenalcaligenes sp.]|uniref:LysR family transcriptional regulator n=1 Tax=uncultured Paenalcaligenes sp. TaxID=1588925 RepID=UPI0026315FA0|nr:LysR family transcriptional regulator [uncultured Paenalcaligenes sp.]